MPTRSERSCVAQRASCNDSVSRSRPRGKRAERTIHAALRSRRSVHPMSIDLDDPIGLMLVAAAALERSGAECAAYGGLALGMYGEPRETRDADFAVTGIHAERACRDLAHLAVRFI